MISSELNKKLKSPQITSSILGNIWMKIQIFRSSYLLRTCFTYIFQWSEAYEWEMKLKFLYQVRFCSQEFTFFEDSLFLLVVKKCCFSWEFMKNYKTSEKSELFFIQINSKLENWRNIKEKEQRIGSGGGIRKRCLNFIISILNPFHSIFVLPFSDFFFFLVIAGE